MTFAPEIYEQIREGAQRSAEVIVPLVLQFAPPGPICDVGCGEGWFAREFANHGREVDAFDREIEASRYEDRGDGFVHFLRADIPRERPDEGYALAVCLEVAEHLPAAVAPDLAALLCQAAPLVVFSAAIPGQGGHGHCHEQWPAYWDTLFRAHGYACADFMRWLLWDDDRVEPWYRQNLLVFGRVEVLFERLRPDDIGLGGPPAGVVHPVVWEHRRQR